MVVFWKTMEGNARLVPHPDGDYIWITTPHVPDQFLKAFLNMRTDFSHIDVIDANDSSTFYDHIVNHPMLEEFMAKEADQILDEFCDDHENPEVAQKFFRIMIGRVLAKLGHNSTIDDFEEFLDYRQNRKSARAVAAARTAED